MSETYTQTGSTTFVVEELGSEILGERPPLSSESTTTILTRTYLVSEGNDESSLTKDVFTYW